MTHARRNPAWLSLDVALVVVFAAVGRRSHEESASLVGVLGTAWPFLAGTVLGWLVSRAWLRPLAWWPTGVSTWLATVVVGMLLRRLTGAGTAADFVLVATAFLGLFLVGWRLVVAAGSRLGARRAVGP